MEELESCCQLFSLKDWFGLLGPPVSWLLVITGWYIVSLQHDRRLTRSEVKGQIDKCKELILSIEQASCEYWTLAGADPKAARLSAEILFRVQLVSLAAGAVGSHCKDGGLTIRSEVRHFRQAVTMHPFQDACRPAGPNQQRLDLIDQAAGGLISEMDLSFSKVFHK